MRWKKPSVYMTYAVLLLMAAFILFPFLWTLITSLKTQGQLFTIPPEILPSPITLENYVDVLKDGSLMVYMKNSIIVAVVTTFLSLLIGAPAAYGFAKYSYRYSGLMFAFVVAIRMVPTIVLSVPYFLMMSQLDLLNTKVALIITYLPLELTLTIWLLEGFFRQIPKELEEAAEIDGLGVIGKLFRIILPISLPSVAIAALFSFLISWNEFMLASTLTRTADAQTMPVGIASFVTTFQTYWGKLTANGMLYILPVMLFTLLAQKGLIKGLTAGAVKE
jgi:ABC-type glycerol-3-phosphate transport system permease component